MSGTKPSYLLSDTAPAAEIERLTQIDELMGPTSQERIARRGIASGWKCLEVGAGVGGLSRWMAEKVGSSGKITATDITLLFHESPDWPQLEVRRHNILEEGLEKDHYDLVHCRLLLANVGDVERALSRMIEALRPGGWLIAEEPGDMGFPGVGESDARVAEFNRLSAEFHHALQGQTRAIELNLYRRLPALFEAAGLVEIGGDHSQPIVSLEGRSALLGTLAAVRPVISGTPFVTEGRLNRLVALASQPALLTAGGSTLGLWGRRPPMG